MHGDTGRVPFGMGTYRSRSLSVGGTAIVKAVDKIIAKGKKIAAHLLEAAETDIEFHDGKFVVAGTDRSKTFGEVALAAYVPHNYPLDKLEPGLNESAFYDPTNFTFPAGTHNPLGAKGCGEAGAIGAPAAFMNAVLDALGPLGVKHLDMPASPHRVWSAIRAAHANA